MRNLFIVAAILILPSCAAYKMNVNHYSHDTADKLKRDADDDECEKKAYEARNKAGGWLIDGVIGTDNSYNKGFEECMVAKGYKRK